ncbi:DUF1102 domain-containing protein [Halalkaliarchaeum sp. AArc-GB]|uniref:DUF1102 domain-containing protein n=1 Tax=Halalkaliarchaeum sp. AArc-GB TaxID=3074078 RepID=UPI00285A3BD3|nr:DUF1102 domain-containing protein [Halalkaliarchaeum sp. AArc-GB]MDR5672297.1 DUF1102 domain-containing protein [Halalkaliarchaeum sp. AArc-GB]
MDRTHIVLLAVALASGLVVVATAGAPIDALASGDGIDVIGPDEPAGATGQLELEPHDGPNGKYAFVNDDDEIEIAIDASNPNIDGERGVNVEAGTTIHDVFTVTYNASTIENNTPVRVWIEHGDDPDTDVVESELLTFTSDGKPIEGENANLTLSPNETASIGLHVDSTGADPGLVTSNFTIRAQFPTEPETDDRAVTTTRTSFSFTSPAPTLCEGTVYNARGGETTRVDACSVEIVDGVTLESAAFTMSSDDTVDVRLEGSPTQLSDRPALDPAGTGAAPLGYFTAEFEPHAGDATSVTDVSYDVFVSSERLATPGIETPGTVRNPDPIDELDPASIRLYGFDPVNESWISLETEVVETTDEGVLLRTDAGRFPVYAVGVDAPVLRVEETSLDPSTVAVDEPATVTVTLANDGLAGGDANLTLRANETVIATTTVAVPAGNRTVATVEAVFDEPGVYEITVDGEAVGELTVEAPPTEDPPETEEPSVTTPGAADSTPSTPEEPDETPDPEDVPTEADGAFDGIEEPAGIDLERTVGLVSLLVIVLATTYLVRRMPRR